MSNTQTQEEYLKKQTKLFKKALNNKDWETARSHLLRIDNLKENSPRGNIRPWMTVTEVKKPTRKERRSAKQNVEKEEKKSSESVDQKV